MLTLLTRYFLHTEINNESKQNKTKHKYQTEMETRRICIITYASVYFVIFFFLHQIFTYMKQNTNTHLEKKIK